jgi:hypothetical protein
LNNPSKSVKKLLKIGPNLREIFREYAISNNLNENYLKANIFTENNELCSSITLINKKEIYETLINGNLEIVKGSLYQVRLIHPHKNFDLIFFLYLDRNLLFYSKEMEVAIQASIAKGLITYLFDEQADPEIDHKEFFKIMMIDQKMPKFIFSLAGQNVMNE